jgi:deoxyribonuclease V
MIACLDVHYAEECASVACVLIESWTDALPHQSILAKVDQIQPYRPGRFYERELPCLLAVLDKIPSPPEICVVDGYVWVSPDGKPGLGALLH